MWYNGGVGIGIRHVRKLKDLYAKRDEEKKKALLEAVGKSKRSYEEIMSFLTSGEDE